MGDLASHRERRERIRRLLLAHEVATQEELGALLQREGLAVTQATLSRDLAKLEARRVTRPDGGTVYELPGAPARSSEGLLQARGLVTTVLEGDAMVVVHTLPGGAPTVARAIDTTRPPGVLGTIAGDDTVFVVPSKGTRPARVRRDLLAAWKKGSPS
jgi:transcriptional regulator of arginine metabolism